MRRPRSALRAAAAALISAALVSGSMATIYTGPGHQHPPPGSPTGDTVRPATMARPTAAAFAELNGRARKATREAAAKGADISVLVLDRQTGRTASNGRITPFATASLAKLFIADDLLFREADLPREDRVALDAMLRSSDDNAAEVFWNRGGGAQIVARVVARYTLPSTAPPPDGRWWNTITNAADLVRYYDMLLDGTGGLPAAKAQIIIGDLSRATPKGVDGYPQRFGIPRGLYAEEVAVKQGWMCCIGPAWVHLSSGVIGADRRYVMVIESREPGGDAQARETITQAVRTMFPDGRI